MNHPVLLIAMKPVFTIMNYFYIIYYYFIIMKPNYEYLIPHAVTCPREITKSNPSR